jgi:uncharacterized protein YdaU (DUF1376 family)
MAALPYMPLFVADYLADTAHLTTQQHGAYMLLIMNYWQRGGPLPDDDVRLAKIARVGPREWTRMRDTISEFFSIADGQWLHSRITTELARVEAKSLKSKRAAQASVQRRFGERSTPAEPTEAQAHTQADKEEKEGGSGGKPPANNYAFFGRTIRLKPSDLERWRQAFHGIPDMEAELIALDAWFEGQDDAKRKQWFHVTAGSLNRKHQDMLTTKKRDDGYDPDVITV